MIMPQKLKKCTLCPRECHVDRASNEKGICAASNKMKIARYSLHLWEEPILSGTNGSGTIFFSHCNLKCIYCQNYQISEKNIGYEITIPEFANICLELQEKGAHNINLVTPTHYVLQIIEGIHLAKKHGLKIPIVYNTSGYEKKETIQMLNGIVDIYLPDFKYFNPDLAYQYSSVSNYFNCITESLQEMLKQVGTLEYDANHILKKGVIVRHLCLPGHVKDSKNVLKYLYQTYKDTICISIMNQYTPVRKIKRFPNLNRTLREEEYDEIINYACDLGITNAFIQEGKTQNSNFIPKFYHHPQKKYS